VAYVFDGVRTGLSLVVTFSSVILWETGERHYAVNSVLALVHHLALLTSTLPSASTEQRQRINEVNHSHSHSPACLSSSLSLSCPDELIFGLPLCAQLLSSTFFTKLLAVKDDATCIKVNTFDAPAPPLAPSLSCANSCN
jgi:hypothetical protein